MQKKNKQTSTYSLNKSRNDLISKKLKYILSIRLQKSKKCQFCQERRIFFTSKYVVKAMIFFVAILCSCSLFLTLVLSDFIPRNLSL